MITETWITRSGEYCRLKWIGSIENYQKESSFVKMATEFHKDKKIVSHELNKVYTWRFKWRYRNIIGCSKYKVFIRKKHLNKI